MIISHKHRFIFIKTQKTAGTSIEVFLSPHCGDADIVTPIYPAISPHVSRNYRGICNPLSDIVANGFRGVRGSLKNGLRFNRFYNHMPSGIVRSRVGPETWKSYFTFCVERNPWDKTLSHYAMINERNGGTLTLEQYISLGGFCLNYPLYSDVNGEVIVDRVIKYESLIDELGPVFDQLGIPFSGTLGISAKSDHRGDRRPYREIYTDEQRAVIQKVFAKEIAMHGYTF